MPEPLLQHTDDGGEIVFANGKVELDLDGLFNAAYLSMFGGNDDDDGTDATEKKQWWGNRSEPDGSKVYRSKTQARLQTLPPTPANLKLIQEAAESDLEWLVTKQVARSVGVSVRIPALNRIEVSPTIVIGDRKLTISIQEKWRGSSGNT